MDKGRINKLRWSCRRSSLELDVLLEEFCQHQLETLSSSELDVFEALLQLPDKTLTDWLLYHHPVSETRFHDFVKQYFHPASE